MMNNLSDDITHFAARYTSLWQTVTKIKKDQSSLAKGGIVSYLYSPGDRRALTV